MCPWVPNMARIRSTIQIKHDFHDLGVGPRQPGRLNEGRDSKSEVTTSSRCSVFYRLACRKSAILRFIRLDRGLQSFHFSLCGADFCSCLGNVKSLQMQTY